MSAGPTFPERFNLARYLLDDNLEAGRGERVCLRFGEDSYTYSRMSEMSDQAGNLLRELGVEIEDRVLLVLPDCPEFVASWFGGLKIGAVFAMVSTAVPLKDLLYYLEYSRAKVAVGVLQAHDNLLFEIVRAASGKGRSR